MRSSSWLYHMFNGAIAVIALHAYLVLGLGRPPASAGEQLQVVMLAGIGSMLIMRSKFFNMKVGGQDVAFGPEQVIRVFFAFIDRAIDRVRAQARVEFVIERMANYEYEKILQYCVAMLDSSQTLSDEDRKKIAAEIEEIGKFQTTDQELRSYLLGFLLLNYMGEDFLDTIAEHFKPVRQIAPTQVPSTGISAADVVRWFTRGRDTVNYFAYAENIAPEYLLPGLGVSNVGPDDVAKFRSEASPKVARLFEYRLAFARKVEGSASEDRATIVRDPNAFVEGVV